MEKFEMTFKEFCENWLANAKYASKYIADSKLWENHKRSNLYPSWEKTLVERAEVGPIPENVLNSFIEVNNENLLFRLFRGRLEKGIQDFRIKEEA